MKLRNNRRKKQPKPSVIRPWSGVRNAAIAVLLAVNVVLLLALGCVKGYDAVLKHQMHKQMDSMLAQQGVLCGSSVYRTMEHAPQAYTLRADERVQKQLAQTLLRGDIKTQAKGSAVVSWSQSGKLDADVQLSDVEVPQDNDQAAEVVENLLKTAGFSVSRKQIAATQDNNGFSVSVQQNIYDTELIGCSLDVAIAPNNIFYITGTWCTGTAQPLEIRALKTYSEQQALFQFLGAKSGAGQILRVQAAYVLSDRSGGRFATIPCWRFSTDQGDYLLNIMTGEVVTAESIGETRQTGDEAEAGSGSAADAGSGTGVTANDADADDALPDLEMPEDGTEQSTSNAATQQNATDAAADIWDAEG